MVEVISNGFLAVIAGLCFCAGITMKTLVWRGWFDKEVGSYLTFLFGTLGFMALLGLSLVVMLR